MNRKIVNIIICETSQIIVEGLTKILNNSNNTCVIHLANNLNEMHQLNLRYNAAIVIINPNLIQNITKDFLSIQKEFCSTHWLGVVYNHIDQQLLSLFEGIIYINETPSEINALIQKMLNLENPLHNQLAQNETLSEREIEVLKLLVNGNANKEIADKLNISINTVITHRKNISQKTGIKSVSGLTIYAVVNNYISVDTM
jgi:DNA-binding NarL/FixJ family response regulator